jgi:hypothetical protein
MSTFVIETGKKGSGKSWLGLRFGQIINGEDNFSMHNVCFSSATLLDRLDRREYVKGDVVLLEELGVSANSRDFMSRTNKNLSFIAQTIRPEGITIISNTITWGLIDCQVKNMADYRIKVLGYDKMEGITEFKFMNITPNDNGTEPRQEHLQFGSEKYTSWFLKRPTEKLTDIYEPLRKEYLRQLYSGKSINENSQFGIEKKTVQQKTSIEEYIEAGLIKKDKIMEKGKINTSLIQIELGIRDEHLARTIGKGIKRRWVELGGVPI